MILPQRTLETKGEWGRNFFWNFQNLKVLIFLTHFLPCKSHKNSIFHASFCFGLKFTKKFVSKWSWSREFWFAENGVLGMCSKRGPIVLKKSSRSQNICQKYITWVFKSCPIVWRINWKENHIDLDRMKKIIANKKGGASTTPPPPLHG